ncbi:MAG TPA: hypothetical protein VMW67_00385 [Desulfobacteria bacterium]|nr:hypothetical protein [Desulfobacteria bacterium]
MKLPEGITDINELAYITSRKLQNEQGEKTGTVVMWRKNRAVLFKKRPYRVKCNNCGKSITIEKLSKK